MNVCKVKCGDKEATIKIQRPSCKSVEKAYEEINRYYIQGKAQAVFEKIGGEPHKEFLNNEQIIKKQNTDGIAMGDIQRYTLNSCALRMSYALNYSYLLGIQYLIKNQKLPT